jgi:hypothetical protein
MGVACSTYEGDENCLPGFGGGKLMARDHLEEPDVDGRIILRWILGSGMWGMEWIDLTPNRERSRAIGNAVMNFRIP